MQTRRTPPLGNGSIMRGRALACRAPFELAVAFDDIAGVVLVAVGFRPNTGIVEGHVELSEPRLLAVLVDPGGHGGAEVVQLGAALVRLGEAVPGHWEVSRFHR